MSTTYTVLIVDDEPTNIRFLSNLLARRGFNTIGAQKGSDALEVLATQAVDIILLDIMMAEMSGLDVLANIREQYSPAHLPVIMVTGLAEDENIEQALKVGANDYLVKPISFKVALARIERLLELKISSDRTVNRAKHLEQAISSSQQGIWEHDLETGELFISSDGLRLLGYNDREPHDEEWWIERIHIQDQHLIERKGVAAARSETHFEKEVRFLDSNNQYRWLLLRYRLEFDNNGKATKQIGTFSDVSQLKLLDKELNLPNELQLRSWLDARIVTQSSKFLVLGLQLSDFSRLKSLNPSSSVAAFEHHLFQATQELLTIFELNTKVARINENQIGIIVAIDDALRRLLATKTLSMLLGDMGQRVDALLDSMPHGIKMVPRLGITRPSKADIGSDAILEDLSVTMAYQQLTGLNIVRITPTIRARASREERLRVGLAQAVTEGGFKLHFQPLICATSTKLAGAEALLRWEHDDYGSVSPAEFIPLAEQTGLILDIGNWVLEQSFEQLCAWEKSTDADFFISVNISARQLENLDLVEKLRILFERYPTISPERLKLEVTETAIMLDLESASCQLSELSKMGVKIALDDFGSGYASLAVLDQLPIDILKVDRFFFIDLLQQPRRQQLVQGIIGLASNLGLNTVVEGIEDEPTLDFIRDAGSKYAQGFYFSKPLPIDEFESRYFNAVSA